MEARSFMKRVLIELVSITVLTAWYFTHVWWWGNAGEETPIWAFFFLLRFGAGAVLYFAEFTLIVQPRRDRWFAWSMRAIAVCVLLIPLAASLAIVAGEPFMLTQQLAAAASMASIVIFIERWVR